MAIDISYNGTVIASPEDGQTATLTCAGQRAIADIVLALGSDGTIAYNGSAVVAYAGKTVTLACSDKVMLTDVVITAGTPVQGVSLVTSDGYVLADTNGIKITTKEEV